MKTFFFLLITFTRLCLASEVTHTGITLRHLLVSQSHEKAYQPLDYLCVVQQGEEVACGFVEKVEARGVLVDLEFRSEDVRIGSKVQRSRSRRPCDPNFVFRPLQDPRTERPLVDPFSRKCSAPEKEKAELFKVPVNHFFSMGFGLGTPRIAFENVLSEAFALGMSAELQTFYNSIPSFTATASGTALGGSLFLAYYPYLIFENIFVHFGIGYYGGRMTLRTDLNTWSGTGMGIRLGYRFLQWQSFGIGLSVSATHFSFKNAEDPTRTEFLYPGVLMEFGGGF